VVDGWPKQRRVHSLLFTCTDSHSVHCKLPRRAKNQLATSQTEVFVNGVERLPKKKGQMNEQGIPRNIGHVAVPVVR